MPVVFALKMVTKCLKYSSLLKTFSAYRLNTAHGESHLWQYELYGVVAKRCKTCFHKTRLITILFVCYMRLYTGSQDPGNIFYFDMIDMMDRMDR